MNSKFELAIPLSFLTNSLYTVTHISLHTIHVSRTHSIFSFQLFFAFHSIESFSLDLRFHFLSMFGFCPSTPVVHAFTAFVFHTDGNITPPLALSTPFTQFYTR